MANQRCGFRAGAVLLLFVSVQLASTLPIFHRHSIDLRGAFRGSAGRTIAGDRSDVSPAGTDCPACIVSGLSAVSADSPVAVAPLHEESGWLPDRAVVLRSITSGSSRGRAPPSA